MDMMLDGGGAAGAGAAGGDSLTFEGAYALWLALRGRAEAAIDAGTRARARHQLMAAVASGDVQGLGMLLERHGAIARAEADDSGNHLLHLAVAAGQVEVTRLLVAHRLNPNIYNALNCTPLHLAAQSEHHAELLAALLESPDIDIAKADVTGFTPLHVAAKFGNTEACRLLLKRGADVNMRAACPLTTTPLHLAAASGAVETVRLLLKEGAKPNVTTELQETPLHEAASSREPMAGMAAIALLEAGAFPDAIDRFGRTPLRRAAHEDNAAVASALVLFDADLELPCADDTSPAKAAHMAANKHVVPVLLASGISPSAFSTLNAASVPLLAELRDPKSAYCSLMAACRTAIRRDTFAEKKTISSFIDLNVPEACAAFLVHNVQPLSSYLILLRRKSAMRAAGLNAG